MPSKTRPSGNILPTGAAKSSTLIHEFNTVALNCPTAVNFCLSATPFGSSDESLDASASSSPNLLVNVRRLRGIPSTSIPSPPTYEALSGSLLRIDGSGSAFSTLSTCPMRSVPADPGGYVSAWSGPCKPSVMSRRRRRSSDVRTSPAVRTGVSLLSSWMEFERRGRARNFLKGLWLDGSPSSSYHARFLAWRR